MTLGSAFRPPGSTSTLQHRPHADLGAGAQTRTADLLITNQLLYQLSYAGGNL